MSLMNLAGLIMIFGRCDAKPTDLDAPGSHQRTHKKTDFLIKNFNPGILWDEYGIQADIIVCVIFLCLCCCSDPTL